MDSLTSEIQKRATRSGYEFIAMRNIAKVCTRGQCQTPRQNVGIFCNPSVKQVKSNVKACENEGALSRQTRIHSASLVDSPTKNIKKQLWQFESMSSISTSESSEKTQSTAFSDSFFDLNSCPHSSTRCSDFNDTKSIDCSLNTSDDPDPATSTPQKKDKYKISRPPDISISQEVNEDNAGFVDVGKCSPVRSPFPAMSDSLNDSLLSLECTPVPAHYETPPEGLMLNPRQAKMVHLLKRFGLSQFIFIFCDQEVDIDLFLTLTNEDLCEIGIQRKTDRQILLNVIHECRKRLY